MKRQTAIITGASEGLGKSFAFELAGRGANLLLVSLPGSGLPELCNYLRINFGVNADGIELDLTDSESAAMIFNRLSRNFTTADILINNAGLGNWSWFEDKNTDFYKTQIDLNITSTVLLTRLFLDQVNKSEDSYILNVGSLGGTFVVPMKQVYGATKSFISYFTRCLQLEQAGSKVHISLLSPGGINTKPELLVMNHSLKGISKATIMEPEEVAKVAVNGLLKGKKEIVPGYLNKLILILNTLLPSFVKEMIMKRNLKVLLKESSI